ncbi:right-handed parallel beta-helix repeat-containing protein [Actinacidiphila reveromycinica]|nr:right-handed parallel beta-helix repeat-containing protein [Streptomyces sp. SN-593]
MSKKRTVLLAAATAAACCAVLGAAPAQAAPAKGRVLRVTSTEDTGRPGTLRWALEQSNAADGTDRIEIGKPAGIIRITSPLPVITHAVTITGAGTDRAGHPVVGIDGSSFIDTSTMDSCPGWTSGSGPNVRSIHAPGLAVEDSGNVTISGLTVRNFCIGLLALRSHDDTFAGNYLANNVGAAGIEVTGDDGAGNSTTGLSVRNTVAHNTFVNNGDGMEYTRGTSDGTITDNVFEAPRDAPGGFLPSQDIEFAGDGDNGNLIAGNTFLGGFSDGLQLSGDSDVVRDNLFAHQAEAIQAGGTHQLIEDNTLTGNHEGIVVSGASTTLTRNEISGDGAPVSACNAGGICATDPAYPTDVLGIDRGAGGVTPDDAGDTDGIQNFPVITTATSRNTTSVTATLASRPSTRYRIEFYADRKANPSGYGDGRTYLTSAVVTTDGKGNAKLALPTSAVRHITADGGRVTATATDLTTGSTSEFSASVAVR